MGDKIYFSCALWKFYDSADCLTKFAENADSSSNHKEIEFLWKILSLQNFYLHLTGTWKGSFYLHWSYLLFVHEIPSYKIGNICHKHFPENDERSKYFIKIHSYDVNRNLKLLLKRCLHYFLFELKCASSCFHPCQCDKKLAMCV